MSQATTNLPIPWFPVLMYHGVVPDAAPDGMQISLAEFRSQLGYLKESGYSSVRLSEALDIATGRRTGGARYVVLTFDDGYLSFMEYALPALLDHGFTATVFVVSDLIGTSNVWDAGQAIEMPLMDWCHLHQLDTLGFTIGSHSRTHPRLARTSPDQSFLEIALSKSTLEQRLGKRVDYFCYPFGSSNQEHEQAVGRAGYLAACGIEQRRHCRFNLSRIDAVKARGAGVRWRLRITGRYMKSRRLLARGRNALRVLTPG